MAGISNVTIEEFIEEDVGFPKNFVGVFSSNRMTPFLNFLKNDKKKKRPLTFYDAKYRWKQLSRYSLVEHTKHISKKAIVCIDSYDFLCFKSFIEQDDGSVINKILYDTKKFNKKDNIVTLVTVTFSRKNFEKLSQNEFLKLSSITATYFTFNEFAELTRIKDEVILHFVDDQLQSKTSDTCGIFQLYFYKNLFHHSKKVKLLTTKN